MAPVQHTVLRKKIHTVIFGSDTAGGRIFDVLLLWAILVSILIVMLESVTKIRLTCYRTIRAFELVFTILFTIEYALRVYSSPRPWKYVFSFYGLIDLVAFLPTYLSLMVAGTQYLVVVRALRLLRVFRILKLTRFLTEGTILRNALQASLHKITVFLLSVLTLVTIIGTLMYIIEGDASGFTSIPVSVYWAIVTITTVGYGDISPVTPWGQALASVLMVIGYGIIAVPTGIVSVEMARATEQSRKKCPACGETIMHSNARFCPACGAAL